MLGAALGGLVGIVIVTSDASRFSDVPGAGAIIVAWIVAWSVLGFSVLPYLTVVPALRVVRGVQALSTAEFVTAVIGLLLGLLMGLLLGSPLSAFPAPLGTWMPIGVSLFLGLGMVGLTVAKRQDLLVAAEAFGLVRRADPETDGRRGDPHIVVDSSAIIDGRIAEMSSRASCSARSWCRASCSTRSSTSRTARTPFAGTGAAVAWRSWPGCRRTPRPGHRHRGRCARGHRGGRKARRGREAVQPGRPDERLQPEPGGRAPGRPRPEHQFARERRQAGAPSRRGAACPGDPAGQGIRAGGRLPGRRDDDRRGRWGAVRRHRGRCRRDSGAPDRRRADDLRPATSRLTIVGPMASRSSALDLAERVALPDSGCQF